MSSYQTDPDTIKPEQRPVQSQQTHCQCKEEKMVTYVLRTWNKSVSG